MREIDVSVITNAVRDAVIKANIYLPDSLVKRIDEFSKKETSDIAKSVFCDMKENLDAAHSLQIPICQDCGMAVIFAEIGQDVHITGGAFEEAINFGVAKGYTEGFLRKSVVKDPLLRENTNDNTPAVIHVKIVPGDKIKFIVAPKGFGSENMSKIKIAVVGIGNCASSLIQGIYYYKDKNCKACITKIRIYHYISPH